MHSTRSLAALSLALGMALAIALSSIADAVIFRPLPVAHPDEIIRIFSASPLHSLGFVSYQDYRDFAHNARTLSSVAAQAQVLLAFSPAHTDQRSETRMGLAVSTNYFDTLGVPVHLGRSFHADEDRQAVVILSDAIWRRQFAADPSIVGHTVSLAQAPFTVIGVAPSHFGLDRFLHEDFYIPVGVYAAGLLPVTGRPWEDRGHRYFSIYARRTASIAAVKAELASIAAQLSREFPLTNHQQSVAVMTDAAARTETSGSLYTTAWVLLALATLSVVVAASNVTGLLLLRGETRAGEYALRGALGASPLRLLREALTESCLLSAVGTIAAIPLAWAAVRAATRLWEMPTDLPIALDARIDARMATLAGAGALLTTLACAIAPARATCRMSLHLTSSRHTGRCTGQSTLVAIQVALATVLLGSCASLLAGLVAVSHVNLGYRTDRILTMAFDPSQSRSDESHTRAFYRELLECIPQLQGIEGAALAQSIPLGFTAEQKQVKIAAGLEPMAIWMNTVTPGYFELMRMRLIAGRDFTAHDTDRTQPVAVINTALAHYWPDGQALGQKLEIAGRPTKVVGIVRTAKYLQAGEAPRPFFYLPYEQNFVPRMSLHILTHGSPASVTPAVVALAHGINPAVAATEIRPLVQFLSHGALLTTRIGIAVTAAVGACAWALSLVGLHACVASSIRRRKREIGIRQALGAHRGRIAGWLVAEGAKLTAAGTALGLVGAGMAQYWIGQVLDQTGTGRWLALTAAGVMVAVAALTACFLPAWRAPSSDPAITFRQSQ